MAGPSNRPTETTRSILRAMVDADARGLSGVAALVGVKPPSLHEFLTTAGAGSKVFPKLCKLYGIDPFENTGLDSDQRELLRILELARDRGRDPAALVAAFRVMVTGEATSPSVETPRKTRPSPKS